MGERPLAHASDYSRAEIDYLVRFEAVERLADIVLRRTTLAMAGALNRENLEDIAGIVGDALGWSKARRADEISATANGVVRAAFLPIFVNSLRLTLYERQRAGACD